MAGHAEYAKRTYDEVAEAYDGLWTANVETPNNRLTLELDIRPGDRVADLACGTGHYTVEMARLSAPEAVVGVDYSEGMLAAAAERAEDEGLGVRLVHARAEEFIARAASSDFDVVSTRFALAYLDWREVLPGLGRLLRPLGRAGVLTSLASSIPQFADLYHRFRRSPEPAWKLFRHTGMSLADTWRIYRQLRETFGEPRFIGVPTSSAEIAERLAAGGLVTRHAWVDTIRLWFATGAESVEWMIRSGYATHGDLERVGPEAVHFLKRLFAEGMEGFREPEGIPLDLVVCGVVAEKGA
ncbi:MAG TPA: class I SAM-dependent methyltransferase [Vicinamibacteria bacterium]